MSEWRHWNRLTICLWLLLLAGCSAHSSRPAPEPAQYRGGLERLPDAELDFIFAAPGFRLANFRRYFVAPLAVTVPVGAIDPEQEARMRAVFEMVLDDELDTDGRLRRVGAPGPGVLVVQPQVVDLRHVPEGFDLPASRFVFRLEEGRMTLVAEIVEGGSGRVLARAADLERDPEASPAELSEWHAVELAFRRWVRRFQERVDASELST